LSGTAFLFRHPFYRTQTEKEIKTPGIITNPEPSTIVFLGLGAIGIVLSRKKSRAVQAK